MVSDALGLSILKSRRGGKGRLVNLSMSAASLAIVDATNRLAVQRIQIENNAINRGEHYDDIYRRQRDAADMQRPARARTSRRWPVMQTHVRGYGRASTSSTRGPAAAPGRGE
jgi:hypothetical protein